MEKRQFIRAAKEKLLNMHTTQKLSELEYYYDWKPMFDFIERNADSFLDYGEPEETWEDVKYHDWQLKNCISRHYTYTYHSQSPYWAWFRFISDIKEVLKF